MASRLEGRVSRIEEKLAPSGGNTWLRQLCEIAGESYEPAPGDELITLEDVVSAANAEWRAELAAQQAAARRETENVVPLRRQTETSAIPSEAPGRAFAVDGDSEPNPAPPGPSPRPAAVPERLRLPPGWSQDLPGASERGTAPTEFDIWRETRGGPGRR